MILPRKPLVAAASIALVAACPAVALSAAAAGATTHTHPHTAAAGHGDKHGGKHGGKHGSKKVDQLAGQRRGTAHAIAAQLRGVTSLITQAGAAQGPDVAALTTALGTDRDAIAADLAAVAGAPDKKSLRDLRHGADVARFVAGGQYHVVISVDGMSAAVTAAQSALAMLQQEVTAMANDKEVVTSEQASLDDASAALGALGTAVQNGVAGVLALDPTAAARDLHTALDEARQALGDAPDLLAQAQADLQSVGQAIGMAPPAN